MKALVLKDVGKISIEEIEKPAPKKGQVLVKVGACGICGSDIPRVYQDGAHNMPLVIGHEFAGTVHQVGSGVNEGWIGKSVGVFPLIPCMNCSCCRDKKYEMCKNYSYLGSRVNGGFADFVLVPEWNLIELPENVTMSQAAMLEPMAVAVHAIRQVFGKQGVGEIKNTRVAVMGLGTIGLLITLFLKDMGFENVYTIGNKNSQAKLVRTMGVAKEQYIDGCALGDNLPEVDVFFECIGKMDSLLCGLNMLAPSGRLCTVGNPYSDMNLPRNIYWKILRNQLTLTGTWNSSFTHDVDDDWHYVLDRLQLGAIKPENFITHKYRLEDILEGFEIMRDKKEEYVKVMGDMNYNT